AATPSLASLPIRGLMPSTTTPSFCRPDATLAGAPDHVRRSSGLPKTDVIATCSKRGLRKVVAPSRASVVSMGAGDIAACISASDQPVTRRRSRPPQIGHIDADARTSILARMFGAVDELLQDDVSDRSTASAVRGRHLFYFGSEVGDASTLKRIQQFIDHGFDVTVFGFHRTRYNTAYEPA